MSTVIERGADGADDFNIFHVTADGNLSIEGLTIRNGSEGNIFSRGTLNVTNSIVSGNTGIEGGGISNANSGRLTLTNSTVSGNKAYQAGGGINNFGRLILKNSTISNNEAPFKSGGGIHNAGIPGSGTLKNTIVAGNINADNPDVSDCNDVNGRLTSLGHNLVGSGRPSTTFGDETIEPTKVFATVLGPLGDNGGPTLTHALLPGSPAIDSGSPDCPPPETDQRGVPRPVDSDNNDAALCDIGAFELGEQSVAALDHFRCYLVKPKGRSRGSQGQNVLLEDQFGTKETRVRWATHLCSPASKNGAPILNSATHLLCYVTQDRGGNGSFDQREVMTKEDASEKRKLQVTRPRMLCIPATNEDVEFLNRK